MKDVTAILRSCAAALPASPSISSPSSCMMTNRSFSLIESMSALELMDPKMDEIEQTNPNDEVTPLALLTSSVLPYNAPTLTPSLLSSIATRLLQLTERSLTGATLPETLLTCNLFDPAVLEHMKRHHDFDFPDFPGPTTPPPTPPTTTTPPTTLQSAIFTLSLTTLRFAGLVRLLVYHGDVYEEEDFSPLSARDFDFSLGRDLGNGSNSGSNSLSELDTRTKVDELVRQTVEKLEKEVNKNDTDADADADTRSCLELVSSTIQYFSTVYELCYTISIGTSEELGYMSDVARLEASYTPPLESDAATEEEKKKKRAQELDMLSTQFFRIRGERSVQIVAKLKGILATLLSVSVSVSAATSTSTSTSTQPLVDLHPIFSSSITKKMNGSQPIRHVTPLPITDTLSSLSTITTSQFAPMLHVLLRSPTPTGLTRNLRAFSNLSPNILSRSVLATILYVNDKVLGQYHMFGYIDRDMRVGDGVPGIMLGQEYSVQFLGGAGVPMFESFKAFLWNTSRIRYVLDKKVLADWARMQSEASIADHLFRQQFGLGDGSDGKPATTPFFSHYCMKKTLSLMELYLSLGLRTKVLFGLEAGKASDVVFAYWYYDYVNTTYLNVLDAIQTSRESLKEEVWRSRVEEEELARQQEKEKAKKEKKGGKGKKKNGKGKKNNSESNFDLDLVRPVTSGEENMLWLEKFDKSILMVKQSMSRGLFRFLAVIHNTEVVDPKSRHDRNGRFTNEERIFKARFQAFNEVKNPPVLTYEQFLTSNDFGTVKSESLLGAALDMFNAAKDKITFILQMIDEEKGEQGGEEEEEEVEEEKKKLIITKEELTSWKKVAVTNAVNVMRFGQILEKEGGDSDYELILDFDTAPIFAIINIAKKAEVIIT